MNLQEQINRIQSMMGVINENVPIFINMNLQEQISRMKSMMGVINENFPNNVKRRLSVIQRLLNVTLDNSYPCDFDDENHFKEGILYDIDTFLIGYEMEGMSSGEIKEFINEYLSDDIIQYYINASEDC